MGARSASSALPGLRPALGFTLFYVTLMLLVPLSALGLRFAGMSWEAVVAAAFSTRALAAYRLSFLASLVAASINAAAGVLLAWVIERYRFPGRRVLDGLVDLPFALPTAVAGIALTALFAPQGWIGRWLEPLGLEVAYTRAGVVVALTFIGLPFVVRTVQPVLRAIDREAEEAAATCGAGRWITFRRVVLPALLPAAATGFTLAFARALGEYGSVIFIAGNLPLESEITPLLIMIELEEFDYDGATAIAFVFMAFSFLLLFAINALVLRRGRRG